jgi:hypothetical protein
MLLMTITAVRCIVRLKQAHFLLAPTVHILIEATAKVTDITQVCTRARLMRYTGVTDAFVFVTDSVGPIVTSTPAPW